MIANFFVNKIQLELSHPKFWVFRELHPCGSSCLVYYVRVVKTNN